MSHIAVYPGTFDPITLGHVDLVERAARIFQQVIVAIAANKNKQPLFSLAERIDLAEQAFIHCPNVKVIGFESLLIDFMRQQTAKIILRGLRVVSDFDYEFQMAGMNRQLAADIDSVFLMPAESYTYISSSFVREIASLGGEVQRFVPAAVVAALHKKLGK